MITGKMITYQDYENAPDKTKFVQEAITKYRRSKEFKKAQEEQEYMAGRNTAILNTRRIIYDMRGIPCEDFTAANFKIRNRMIHRLVTDRCSYSLGNGVSFSDHREKKKNADGKTVTVDKTKEELGDGFDQAVYQWAYWALSNGAAFLYVHVGHDTEEWQYSLFKKTEFLPLKDEKTRALRGGIRFWSIDWGKKPITAVLYAETGYTRYETPTNRYSISDLQEIREEQKYTETVQQSEAYGEEVVGTENFSTLPIFPLYSGENEDSALDILKPLIDAYDMILSGFANDLQDCAQIYWLISGALGMTEPQKKQLLDRLVLQHMLVIDGENSSITPHTQEIPYNARNEGLKQVRNQMYENYGGFDVHTIEAGSTNDHIEAGYWPMDEEADAFEYQLIVAIQQILDMIGIEDVPVFKRNRVSNQKEQTDMVLAADFLDTRTKLEKLPWITVDEVDDIMARIDGEEQVRFEKDMKNALEEAEKKTEEEDDQDDQDKEDEV